jgi:hypothetical protein
VRIDGHNHLGVDLFFYLNGYHPYAQDLPALVTEGRHCGIDRWVVFPMVSNLTFDVPAMRRKELVPGGCETVPYAFENERMLREIYQLYPDLGRLTLPFAILDPLREPAAQVKKLRELHARFPFHGLKIQATVIKSDVRALLREGRVFLELAAELNLPFLIHSSVAPGDTWSQARDILHVAEATPAVRFCLAHSCRFDREYLDRVAQLPNTWFSALAADGRDLAVVRVNEEHGYVRGSAVETLSIGERILFTPAHVCTVVNLTDTVVVTGAGEPGDTWRVEARGRTQ